MGRKKERERNRSDVKGRRGGSATFLGGKDKGQSVWQGRVEDGGLKLGSIIIVEGEINLVSNYFE